MSAQPPQPSVQERSAVLRTRLANERTQLAWWRTGLTAGAMAIAVGRILPEIDDSDLVWPYATLGLCFALYGIGLLVYGTRRAQQTEAAITDAGYEGPSPSFPAALTAVGAMLLFATAILIVAA